MLPQLILDQLCHPEAWYGMAIRHEFPNIDRIWLKDDSSRSCLHRLYPSPVGCIPYFHRHPWSCHTRLLYGSYDMDLGFGFGPETPAIVERRRLNPGDVFVMDRPDAWHTVEPVDGPVYTVFQILNKWESGNDTGVCKSKQAKLGINEISSLLDDFSLIVSGNKPKYHENHCRRAQEFDSSKACS